MAGGAKNKCIAVISVWSMGDLFLSPVPAPKDEPKTNRGRQIGKINNPPKPRCRWIAVLLRHSTPTPTPLGT